MKAFVSKCISCTMCKCCWTCICPGVSVGPGSLEASWTREDLVVTTRNPPASKSCVATWRKTLFYQTARALARESHSNLLCQNNQMVLIVLIVDHTWLKYFYFPSVSHAVYFSQLEFNLVITCFFWCLSFTNVANEGQLVTRKLTGDKWWVSCPCLAISLVLLWPP